MDNLLLLLTTLTVLFTTGTCRIVICSQLIEVFTNRFERANT